MAKPTIYQGIALIIVSALFSSCKQKGFTLEPITDFKVETVKSQKVDLNSSYPVTIKGKQDVEIRPQVSGFIVSLCVDEGATVKKGQTLFIIDPVQYEAAVESAKAAVEAGKAAVATAQLSSDNKNELYKKNIISDYERQAAENTLKSAKAQLLQAESALVQAQKNLSFTKVTSPSDGIVGTIAYRLGALVGPSIATPLTVVSDISEMYAYFCITEKELLSYNRQYGNTNNILSKMPKLKLKLSDGTIYEQEGVIETLSGVVDASTGSITVRALFKNPQQLLRSGSTGSVLFPYSVDDAIVIPQDVTYEIQDKKYVYVLQADSTVKNTEIVALGINDGVNYVVTEGLHVGDVIAAEGIPSLSDGMKINPITGTANTEEK